MNTRISPSLLAADFSRLDRELAGVSSADAIHLVDLHAVIDYERCLSCGACAEVCPRHVIHDRFGIITARR